MTIEGSTGVKYGACTWIFGGEPLERTAERLTHLGYDGVELKGDLELYEPRQVKQILDRHSLQVLSITPENEDLAHPDKTVRRAAVDYYQQLLDFAVAVGSPIVCCHGAVGRIRALSSYGEEYALFIEAVRQIARRAEELNLTIAMEALNRYESHLLNTSQEAIRFVEEVDSPRLGILLDAYHMNIEEKDLRSAILTAQDHLVLFHVADSNRQAVGRGHTDFIGIMRILKDIGYQGAIIVENVAPGPDPFTAIKDATSLDRVARYTEESLRLLRLYEEVA